MYGPPPPPPMKTTYKVSRSFMSRYAYIFKLVWEASPAILIVMSIVSLLNGLFPILGAYITSQLLNEIVEAFNLAQSSTNTASNLIFQEVFHNPEIQIVFWICIELVYLIVKSLINNAYNAFVTVSGEKVANHIKVKIISKSKDIDLSQFDMPEFYEKFENASREASFRPVQIISASFNMISNLISLISFITVLAILTPWAPIVVFVISLPAAIIKFVYGRKNFLYMRRRSKDRRQMEYYSNVLTNKDLVKEVRIFNLSDTFIGKFKSTFAKYFKGLKSLIIRENIWHTVISIVTALVNAALFLYVAIRVCYGDINVGDYSFYAGSLNSIISCVATIVAATATIYQGTLFIDNVMEFNTVKPKIVPIQEPALNVQRHVAHTIEFKNVSFAYPGSDKLVIDNLSFTLEKGTTTVLVGLNGAGKTTIIKLLTRLYDPIDGIILLDGEDIRKYDTEQLYSIFGTIFQDFGKYAVTIGENISFGDISKDQELERVEMAASHSGANEFIQNYPNGYNTSLMKFFDDNAAELSIGQWQKLSVARAFYSDSDIMILDEPTASLDAIAEQQIFKQFEELTKDKTSIFVSHRLSSATTADNILVIEHGKLIEEGSHKELMNKQGKYYDLFTTQAKRYLDEN
ncbi:MAG: ABC transporter ATP-binding protein [Clostridia bacterium]|nr:ABC transporter ATP-binding protein [Clostridia bacterium]